MDYISDLEGIYPKKSEDTEGTWKTPSLSHGNYTESPGMGMEWKYVGNVKLKKLKH